MRAALPPLIYITAPLPATLAAAADQLRGQVRQATAMGAGMVYFRQPGWRVADCVPLLETSLEHCRRQGVRLVAGRPWLYAGRPLPLAGIHLRSSELDRASGDEVLHAWRRSRPGRLLGASCHTAGELALAEALGCDYALLGPVKSTGSHPGARPLGWQRFRELAAATGVPVYALGGLEPADLDRARAAGAFGVAGISGFNRGSEFGVRSS